MSCEPVVYESALGFIEVANEELGASARQERFQTTSIIACVFYLDRLGDAASALQLTPDSISQQCAMSLPIVKSAFEHFRLQFVDAEKIWKHCLEVSRSRSVELPYLTADITSFVKTRASSRTSIKKEEIGFVYQRNNLSPAPRTGHPWAID